MKNIITSPATPSKRFLAFVIEIMVMFAYMISVVNTFDDAYGSDISFLLGFVTLMMIHLAIMTRSTTIGKLVLNMKVVNRRTGKDLSFIEMVFREFLGKWISLIFFAIGFIWIMVDNENRAWHDMIFGTMVVEVLHVPIKKKDEHDDDFYVKG